MADGNFATLVSKDTNLNSATNPIVIQISDGTDTVTVDGSGNLNVNITNASIAVTGTVSIDSIVPGTGATNLGKAVDSVGGATDTGVLALAIRDDVLSTLTPVDGDYVRLRTDSTGALWVKNAEPAASTTEVHDYSTATVAGSGTDNHDYTVVNNTFLLRRVDYSSSGSMKVDIQTGPVASLVTVRTGFIPKRGGDGVWDVSQTPHEVPVASTGTVRVIRTNREGQSQDVYSTIVGNDV